MSRPANPPVNLFTNGSYWFCPECGEENIAVASRHEVDLHDPSIRDLVEYMFENGEFDDQIFDDDDDEDEDGEDGEVRVFMPSGTLTLFREPQSVQCGSCGEVYPTHLLSIEESYQARKWADGSPPADESAG